jgi:hypothetical protein
MSKAWIVGTQWYGHVVSSTEEDARIIADPGDPILEVEIPDDKLEWIKATFLELNDVQMYIYRLTKGENNG